MLSLFGKAKHPSYIAHVGFEFISFNFFVIKAWALSMQLVATLIEKVQGFSLIFITIVLHSPLLSIGIVVAVQCFPIKRQKKVKNYARGLICLIVKKF